MPYFQLIIAICAEVLATSCLKAADGFTRPLPSVVTLIGYGVAFYFLSLTLQSIPTGTTYAIWSGVGVVLVTFIAWIVQGQKIDGAGLVGIGLILAGVLVINLFSKNSAH
ncbi:DMT family transporter [Acetobacter sp.]|uniref:DMT family transporter n=1 Tax=Acetobacter sp. TaxID=440 RepID=UPI0025C18E0F|nr:multidrug efflux SMR transporter [Acetobacter sp.]MCH4090785.1 multidrug efflux SMR transporter [Acetobacter sp.]MCI1300499.1 multidrug efflux SMR transporter [Acetobacter sp.]MCI1316299.1 multidrug efflux SMR transporter [Acetobacter sp.]